MGASESSSCSQYGCTGPKNHDTWCIADSSGVLQEAVVVVTHSSSENFDDASSMPSATTLRSVESCPECRRRLSWTDGTPVHAYASNNGQRCRFDPFAAPPTLQGVLSTHGDQTLIRLVGDLDIAAAPDLVALVNAAAQRPGMRTLVVDLAGVSFMDSTGLGALIQARRLCADRGAELSLQAIGPRVRRVLDITGMSTTFGLSDEDDARC